MKELTEPQKQWIDALRSGMYKQGRGVLREDDNFCCLGVACDLAIKAGVPVKVEVDEDSHVVIYDHRAVSYLPDSVRDWLGLRTVAGEYVQESAETLSLVYHNDGGRSFEEIADIIVENAEDLFV